MWDTELGFVRAFARDLESRPPLPAASPEVLDAHAEQVEHLHDLLSMVASLSVSRRPPVLEWDEVLAPLWRRLFAKGDDIDRYTLAEPWYRVLVDTDEPDRALRVLSGRIASARNFLLYDEALALAQEGRRLMGNRVSGACANFLNTEGSIHYFRKDYGAASYSYSEAYDMAAKLTDEECRLWIGVDARTFRGQETFNLLSATTDRAAVSEDRARGAALETARALRARLETFTLGEGFWSLGCLADVEIALAEGDCALARGGLARLESESHRGGPYSYPLQATLARLHSRLLGGEGRWEEAYEWVRKALQASTRCNFPAEEQLVLDQAVCVLQEMQGRPSTLQSLASDLVLLLEDKDWYTGRAHSRRVSRLSGRVAQAINEFAGQGLDIERQETAGLLHDIGKLRCPWSLLNKIAPLTPKERALLHDHSARGEELLREIGIDESICSIVGEHHECLDGSGYPRGRTPTLEGAVVGLCDVFDAAVTPNRRYKTAKSREEALEEIRILSGRLYAPLAVEALLKIEDGQEDG